jgi:polyhydroxyalkanoate synthesis regulator phasin
MNLNIDLIVALLGNLVLLGIFIGVTKSSQTHNKEMLKRIDERLQRMEDKEDKRGDELSQIRERIAVLENEIKK